MKGVETLLLVEPLEISVNYSIWWLHIWPGEVLASWQVVHDHSAVMICSEFVLPNIRQQSSTDFSLLEHLFQSEQDIMLTKVSIEVEKNWCRWQQLVLLLLSPRSCTWWSDLVSKIRQASSPLDLAARNILSISRTLIGISCT